MPPSCMIKFNWAVIGNKFIYHRWFKAKTMNIYKSPPCGIRNAVNMTTTISCSIIFSDRTRTADPCRIATGKDMATNGSKSIAFPSEEVAVFVTNVCIRCVRRQTCVLVCLCLCVCFGGFMPVRMKALTARRYWQHVCGHGYTYKEIEM